MKTTQRASTEIRARGEEGGEAMCEVGVCDPRTEGKQQRTNESAGRVDRPGRGEEADG